MSDHYLRLELEQLIQKEPAVFTWIEEGSLDGVWYWDLVDGDQEWMSPRFCEIFGYEYGELPNTAAWWQSAIFPEDLVTATAAYAAHAADPDIPYDLTARYRHKNGSTVWVRCRGLIIRDNEGKPVRMLGAHTEITQHMETEKELQRSVHELAQFAFVASHDLQEPLRMVTNFLALGLESLEERGVKLLPDEIEAFNFASDGATRMKRLIAGLLEYSRVGRDFATRPFAATEAVDEALAILNGAVTDRGAEVVVGDLPEITGDFPSIARVFQNLIGNALKFRHEDRPLVVKVDGIDEGPCWRFSIQDNGAGFEQAFAEQIFVIFRRLGSEKNGEGLGLAVCRRIVERHQGSIWAESCPDIGSTFFFTIMKPTKVGEATG